MSFSPVSDTLASPHLLQPISLHCDVLQDLLPSLWPPSPAVFYCFTFLLSSGAGGHLLWLGLTLVPLFCTCVQTSALPSFTLHPHSPKDKTAWNKTSSCGWVGCWVRRDEGGAAGCEHKQCPQPLLVWIACFPICFGE